MKYFFIILFIFSSNIIAEELPLESFTKHGDYLNMDLSPDGEHIAARIRIDGKVNLVVLNTKTMDMIGGVRPRNNDEIHSAVWVNNDRLIYQYAETFLGSDQPTPTGELYAINKDGTNAQLLFGYKAGEMSTGTRIKKRKDVAASGELLSRIESEPHKILIIEYPWSIEGNVFYDRRTRSPIISILDIRNGKRRQQETIPFPGAQAHATSEGEVLFVNWSDENNRAKAAYRANDEAEWIEMDDADGTFIPIGLSKNGEKVYLRATVGPKELNAVFELDVATGEKTQIFTDLEADISFLNWDPLTDKPAVAFTFPNKVKYHYTSEKSKTATYHKALIDAFGGKELSIQSQSRDGKLMLVHVRSSINPGEYYLFNTETNGADFLWANRSWLDPRQMQAKQPISFQSSDGLTINGFITMPKATDAETTHPMVVMIHGGPHGVRDSIHFDSEVQLLANRGYAVLQVNFRGSGGFGDVFDRAGQRKWGTGMIRDINEGANYAIENFPINGDKVCTYGASYGGYAALMTTVREPDMYKCAIGYVGIYDLNYAYSESDVVGNLGGIAYLNDSIGTNKAELDEFSPVNHADKIKAEVMLIHGDKDARVPVINSEKMLEKLEAAGKKVPYLNFSKSGHGVYDEKGRLELYGALLEFLDKNIGQ